MPSKFTIFLFLLFHLPFRISAVCPGIPEMNCTCSLKPRGGIKSMKCNLNDRLEDLASLKTLSIILDLSDNNFTVVPAELNSLTKLKELDLENNNIQTIERGAFSKLRNLKKLVLSNNKLEKISKEMFEGLKSLEHLIIAKNFLTTVSEDTFSELKSSLQLNLTGNPLVCNCDIWWLRTTTLTIAEPLKCDSPPALSGQLITKVAPDKECNWYHRPTSTLHLYPDQDQIVFEGDSLRLSCEVDEYSESRNNERIFWTLVGQEHVTAFPENIQGQHDKNERLKNVLNLDDLQDTHSGKWTCNFVSQRANKSASISIVVISKQTVFCPVTVTENNKGRYVWPETISGHKVNQPCLLQDENTPFPYATQLCSSNGTWEELNTNNCHYTSNITRILLESSKMNLTEDKTSLIESALSLRNFTRENMHEITDFMDFHFIVVTLENYIPYLRKEPELGRYLIEITNCALKLPKHIMEKAQQQRNSCTRLIGVIENIMKYSSMSEFQNDEFVIKEMLVSAEAFPGMTCSWIKSNLMLDNFNCSYTDKAIVKGQDIEASVQLPSNLFQRTGIPDTLHGPDHHLMIAMFKDNHLFPDRNTFKESSTVMAINLIDTKTGKLEKPIFVKVKNYENSNAPILAWWDVEVGIWKKDVCHLLSSQGLPTPFLSFQCYRLGYFSLLSEQDDNILYFEKDVSRKPLFHFLHPSIYVGTFISVTCLLLASATYFFCYSHIQMSKKMKHSLANTWISTSLFFLIFSIGIHQTEQDLLCQIIGLSIHYFALATLFWMAVTIKALYKRVQKSNPSVSTPSEDIPSDVTIQKPILGIYLVGWGISSIICGISGAVNMRGYSSSRYCFLTPGSELSTVLIPASLVLFYLTIMCLLVKCATGSPDSNPQLSVGTQAIDLELLDTGCGRNSYTQERCSVRSVTTPSSQAEDTEHSPARQLRAFVIYLVLYLIGTVCSAFCVMLPLRWPYEEKLFSLAYATICVLMGAFVIFFHCFARNDVRSAWSEILGGRRFRRKSPHIIANSLITPVSFRPSSNEAPSGIGSKPASVDNNSARAEFQKQTANINLVRLHRQHYRGCSTTADNFYNPHQSIVAKKFFKKQRRKRNTLQIRKCRSGGSSPVSMGLFEDSAKATGTRTEDENTKFLTNSNEPYDEFSSEKHPLTYDEPDITGCEGKTGTESEATFTVPEYAEIQEHSLKYAAAPYKAETKEQMCDRDWCSCDAISDVNSEPTYNYAYIKNGYCSSRSVMSDNSSVNSHLYTAVAPDVVSSSVDQHRRRFHYRQPVRNSYRNYGRISTRNANPNCPPVTNDFKRRRKEGYKLPPEVNASDFSSEDKVETSVTRTTHYPHIL